MDGGPPFRFISFNLPNLQMIEDNIPFAGENPWRLPDQFEIDGRAGNGAPDGRHGGAHLCADRGSAQTTCRERPVMFWGRASSMKKPSAIGSQALKIANEQGIRLIIPLVDNWKWQGGRAEYAGCRGKRSDDFWTDPQLIADFKETIRFVLLRTNTLTGVRYCDDKAILCWETGNEIAPTTKPGPGDRALHQKPGYEPSGDGRVMPGHCVRNHSPSRKLTLSQRTIIPAPRGQTLANSSAKTGRRPKAKSPTWSVNSDSFPRHKWRRPCKTIMDTGISGGLLWSLRFRDRDGGFYWHSEPSGGNLYKGFHWPASTTGAAYDEINLMAASPSLRLCHPRPDSAAHSHSGSTPIAAHQRCRRDFLARFRGRRRDTVERAPEADGPWDGGRPRN